MRICIAAFALSLLSLSVLAQTPEPKPGKGQGTYSTDLQKFCPDTPRGKGQVCGCLKSHQAELSDACKAANVRTSDESNLRRLRRTS
jgi:hypothetical protein